MFQSYWRPLQGITARKVAHICVPVVLGMLALQLYAVDITEFRVYENSGTYHIKVIAEIDAPAEYVHKTLTDYDHIYRLNPSITESRLLPSPGNGAVRVKTRILDCIFIFCMDIERVEDVYEFPAYALSTEIVPALSSFRSGRADWQIEDRKGHSQVIYEAQMEPDFVIIPIIGPSFVKRILRKGMVASLGRIECIAKIHETLEWDFHLHAAGIDINAVCGETCDTSTGQCQP